jgi:hypothetical protein
VGRNECEPNASDDEPNETEKTRLAVRMHGGVRRPIGLHDLEELPGHFYLIAVFDTR